MGTNLSSLAVKGTDIYSTMNEFDFDDDQEHHDGNAEVSSSASLCSHSSTVVSGSMKGNKKKRYRLNHGAAALPCRADPVVLENDEDNNLDDEDQDMSTFEDTTKSSSRINNTIAKAKGQTMVEPESEEYVAKSSRSGIRQTRRRKNHIPNARKKKEMTSDYNFSSCSSPLQFCSPSSFLSSIKSSSGSSAAATIPSTDNSASPKKILVEKDHLGKNNIGDCHHSDSGEDGLEISSECEFGTPPGSPPRKQRKIYFNHTASKYNVGGNRTSAPSSPAIEKEQPSNGFVSSMDPPKAVLRLNAEINSAPSLSSLPSSKSALCDSSVTSQKSQRSNLSRASRKANQLGCAQRTKVSKKVAFATLDESDDEEDFNDMKSPQLSQANSSIISYESERVVTGAGTDMYAVQDAGSSRLILDDCNYFCSSFMSGIGVVEGSETETKKHCTITADSACDLAIMLSSKKTRGILTNMSAARSKRMCMSQESEASVDNNTFICVLKVVGHVPQSIKGSYLPPSVAWSNEGKDNYNDADKYVYWDDFTSAPTSNEDSNEELPTMQKEIVSETPATGSSFVKRRTKRARQMKDAPTQLLQAEASVFDSAVTNALAITAHFISLECTYKNTASASSSAATARAFRKELLRNKAFMNGIARLLLADHIVACILERSKPAVKSSIAEDASAKDALHDETDMADEKDPAPEGNVAADPTSRGRRKKRKRKVAVVEENQNLNSIPEDESQGEDISTKTEAGTKDGLDFLSDEASNKTNSVQSSTSAYSSSRIPSRFKRKIASALSKIDTTATNATDWVQGCSCIFCGELSTAKQRREVNPGNLALDAFCRILSGKINEYEAEEDADDEAECNEEHVLSDEDEKEESRDGPMGSDDDGVENANLGNPMIFKNVMVRRSGAIPFLARAIVETLESCIAISVQTESGSGSCCAGCIHYLKNRLIRLSSLIDSLCCMSGLNRKLFCRVADKGQLRDEPFLLPSLLRSVLYFSAPSLLKNDQVFSDIGLAALRTLTSLTHENPVASGQFYSLPIAKPLSVFTTSETPHGVEIILNLMYQLVEGRSEQCSSQHIYDSIIFCLNSLTNVLESPSFPHVCKLLLNMRLMSNEKQESVCALAWLSRWIVSQTESFRDAVMTDSPKNNDSRDSSGSRHLEHHEDEFLLISGNGFILLSYLLVAHPMAMKSDDSTRIRIKSLILDELPENSNKLILVINTLKAFCNFYRYSIGELSVAVIAPVLKLIVGLENISNNH